MRLDIVGSVQLWKEKFFRLPSREAAKEKVMEMKMMVVIEHKSRKRGKKEKRALLKK